MQQLDFAYTHVRASDPQTSRHAAESMADVAPGLCERVLRALTALGSAGAEQIGARCGMDPYAVRKRLADLEREGRAYPTDAKRTTSTGRAERVWRAA